jgi:hypothetical protein
LNDFIAEKYPGTEKSYSSFESKVTIQDSSEVFDARIYMNNILDYEGIVSFNLHLILTKREQYYLMILGTAITYVGYFIYFLL